jgi:hypothetical protein
LSDKDDGEQAKNCGMTRTNSFARWKQIYDSPLPDMVNESSHKTEGSY